MMVFLVVILGTTVVEEAVRVMAGSEKKKGEERKGSTEHYETIGPSASEVLGFCPRFLTYHRELPQ